MITPNRTEAALLTGLNMDSPPRRRCLHGWTRKTRLSRACGGGGGGLFRPLDGERAEFFRPYLDIELHGTGDVFTSALCGGALSGMGMAEAFLQRGGVLRRVRAGRSPGGSQPLVRLAFEEILRRRLFKNEQHNKREGPEPVVQKPSGADCLYKHPGEEHHGADRPLRLRQVHLSENLNRMNDLIPDVKITGEVRYKDSDIFAPARSALRREIGMVFQKPNPFPMSIYDNIATARARIKGKGHAGRDSGALRGAAIWDEVKDRLKKNALGLSGGQQQALHARALAVEPEVLLMDEPTSALDPISTSKIEELASTLKERSPS